MKDMNNIEVGGNKGKKIPSPVPSFVVHFVVWLPYRADFVSPPLAVRKGIGGNPTPLCSSCPSERKGRFLTVLSTIDTANIVFLQGQ